MCERRSEKLQQLWPRLAKTQSGETKGSGDGLGRNDSPDSVAVFAPKVKRAMSVSSTDGMPGSLHVEEPLAVFEYQGACVLSEECRYRPGDRFR